MISPNRRISARSAMCHAPRLQALESFAVFTARRVACFCLLVLQCGSRDTEGITVARARVGMRQQA